MCFSWLVGECKGCGDVKHVFFSFVVAVAFAVCSVKKFSERVNLASLVHDAYVYR